MGDEGGEAPRIRVVDLAGRGLLSRFEQLVAGGDDGDAGAAEDGDLGEAERGEDGDLGAAEERARFEHAVALADVFAAAADVGSGGGRLEDGDVGLGLVLLTGGAEAGFVGLLEGDDGIRAVRHRSAGHDADGAAGADAAVVEGAGGEFADDG